ncbi:phosphoesterase PA-phosphatase related [Hymenobacter roseosalivarius DSM 11622]|uniref:Phosphoesterase PA-phosphatase related n=1 Tax=Hymenobacter roseosalivarius DSM 11622 TaxID=645990 RepID=A0A1W1VPL9_9BACT|nr:phosphatase PAP2 family protein [Hymenobacter roseosalivarius]SMB95276.1 phosphoesterase PA-phosphatase related [Hymenobacter roseosalivarius DSM 11622]
MRSFLLTRVTALLLLVGASMPTYAQVLPAAPPAADTLHKFENSTLAPTPTKKAWYRGKLVRASIVPALLIGYGISTINGHGLYSSYDARRDLQRAFPTFHTRVDDALIFAPYLELGAVALAGIESRDDRLNTLLIIGKAEAVMLASVYALKYATNIDRPNGKQYAFPSGHTAQAFLAASIVHTEFRDKSQWYGIGAYTIATGVGALRMLNNKHWQSDVFAGAGVGILSAHLAYLSHRNRWGRQPRLPAGMSFSPTYYGGAPGLSFTWRPR